MVADTAVTPASLEEVHARPREPAAFSQGLTPEQHIFNAADNFKTAANGAAGEEEPWVCVNEAAEAELYFPTGESKNVKSQGKCQEPLLASSPQGSEQKTPTMARCSLHGTLPSACCMHASDVCWYL